MPTQLPVRQGISSPAVTSIPKEWNREWFRYFIDYFLTGADIRNVTTGPGIQITGNVSGNQTNAGGSGVVIGQSPIANNTVLGNVSGITAVPSAISQAQLTALINTFTGSLNGDVPASGGGTANFLRADGTWAIPAGSGTIPDKTVLGNVSGGTATAIALTQTQLTALINIFTTTLSGAVPAPTASTGKFLRDDSTWAAVTAPPTAANPTSLVSLSTVNGVLSTYMRSDGAPALDQSIAPTWTGLHIFSGTGGTPVTISAAASQKALQVNGGTANIALTVVSALGTTTAGADISVQRSASSANTVLKGANIVMADNSGAVTSSVWQHSGGQTELWQTQNNGVSWDQIIKVATTRAITTIAPAGGATSLTVNGASGGNTLQLQPPSGGTGFLSTDGTTLAVLQHAFGGAILGFGSLSNHEFDLISNNISRIKIAAAGNVTITVPTSGDTLTVAPSVTSGALMATNAALTTGAGASAGTLTNAPSAGNPTKWIKINDNGTIRSIPAW